MKFNPQGALVEPEFHDGHLTGLRMEGDTLKLYLVTTKEEKFVVSVPNVAHLKADNFLQGNIVFGIIVYSTISEAKLRALHGYDEEAAARFLPANFREITDKKLQLLELGSSYGCELMVLFSGSIQIESDAS